MRLLIQVAIHLRGSLLIFPWSPQQDAVPIQLQVPPSFVCLQTSFAAETIPFIRSLLHLRDITILNHTIWTNLVWIHTMWWNVWLSINLCSQCMDRAWIRVKWSFTTIPIKAGETTDPSCYSFAMWSPAYISLITSARLCPNSTLSSSNVRLLTDFLCCRDHFVH